MANRLGFALVVLFYSLRISAGAAPQVDARTEHVRQTIHKVIDKHGLGPEARVSLKLKSKAIVEGFVSRIGPDDFEVTNPSLHSRRTIYFRDVAKIATDIRALVPKGRRDTGSALTK